MNPDGTDPLARWQRDLGDQLVAAAERLVERRRRRRRVAAGAAGAIVVATIGVGGLTLLDSGEPAAAAVIIEELSDGSTAIELAERDRDATDASERLRSAGFEVGAIAVPTGPSRIGEVVSLSVAGRSGESVVVGPDEAREIELLYGVAADAGEDYFAPTDPFAEGEPLADADVDRSEPPQVMQAARARGLEVTILSPSGMSLDEIDTDADDVTYLMLSADRMLATAP